MRQSNCIYSKKTSSPVQYSFQINTIWHHVTMNGSVGTDQHGNRWFLRNGNLYSEFSYHIIDIEPVKHSDPNEEIDMIIQDKIDRNEPCPYNDEDLEWLFSGTKEDEL